MPSSSDFPSIHHVLNRFMVSPASHLCFILPNDSALTAGQSIPTPKRSSTSPEIATISPLSKYNPRLTCYVASSDLGFAKISYLRWCGRGPDWELDRTHKLTGKGSYIWGYDRNWFYRGIGRRIETERIEKHTVVEHLKVRLARMREEVAPEMRSDWVWRRGMLVVGGFGIRFQLSRANATCPVPVVWYCMIVSYL